MNIVNDHQQQLQPLHNNYRDTITIISLIATIALGIILSIVFSLWFIIPTIIIPIAICAIYDECTKIPNNNHEEPEVFVPFYNNNTKELTLGRRPRFFN